jgi:alkylation response protein AidB-like acyl-CoA dehydrogenase
MGVFDVLALGVVEAAIVFEQLGAHLATGPVLWSTVGAPLVPGARLTGVRAGETVVAHVSETDAVLIVHDDRVERVASADLAGTAGEPLDPLTPMIVCDAAPFGEAIAGADAAQRLRTTGTVLVAAMLVGGAQGALDVATNYARERHQFGVPIGSFQAVKHLLADMYVRTELARAATYAAAAIVDDPGTDDVTEATSIAKVLAGDAGSTNARTAVQVLGGMGFTWEMLPHYFLKRAWVLEHTFGTADAHALALHGQWT